MRFLQPGIARKIFFFKEELSWIYINFVFSNW